MKKSVPKYRHDVRKAGEIISELLPDRTSLSLFAALFAASCRQAHAQSPACWEVTLTPKYLTLNVGPVALLSLEQDHVFLCSLPLKTRLSAGIRYDYSPSEPVYTSVPIRSASLRLSPDKLNRIDSIILNLHLGYVAEAAIRRSVSVWSYAHSPAALEYLAGVIGEPIPQPLYPLTERFWSGPVTAIRGEFENIQKSLDSYIELNQKRVVLARREQSLLRQYLFRDSEMGICAICGGEFPVSLLIAAHIKPRAKCNDAERRDYENNIIPMCLLGCDALFERGLLVVEDGKVEVRMRAIVNERLCRFLKQIEGRPTSAWRGERIKYFSWHARHATNIDQGV